MIERRRVANAWEKEVWGGRLVDLVNPKADDIYFVDIAHGLANATRFGGASLTPYSIAQHSLLVASLLPPELAVHGLLHDAHEAYVDDITSPTQAALRAKCPSFKLAYKALKERFDVLIYQRAGVALPNDDERGEIVQADLIALAIEQRDLMLGDNEWLNPYRAGHHPRLVALPWNVARDRYIAALTDAGIPLGLSEVAA